MNNEMNSIGIKNKMISHKGTRGRRVSKYAETKKIFKEGAYTGLPGCAAGAVPDAAIGVVTGINVAVAAGKGAAVNAGVGAPRGSGSRLA